MAHDSVQPVPFSDIKPKGWLQQQMQKDLDSGFVGQLDKLVPDLISEDDIYDKDRLTKKVKRKDVGTHNSGAEWEVQFLWWNSETQSNWWDGYLRNALLLESEEHKAKVDKYIEQKLASADENGYIGIYASDLRYNHNTENGELWAQASLFRGMLAYYEATGKKEVLTAVERAVRLTMKAYPIGKSTPFKATDAFAGVGHGLTFVDILYTLYRLTQDVEFLDYAVFLYDDYSAHPQPEEDIQVNNLLDENYSFKGHGVHTYEHLRALTMAAYHSQDDKYAKALEAYLTRLEKVTTASGGPIGDEWIAGRHAHHTDTGYEYCSLQELLHSYAVLLHKTGDAKWADKMEWLVFNAAQGARHPDGKSVAYCKNDNSFDVLGHLDMNQPQGEMRFKYSPAHQDVAVCCVPNAGRVYPYFTQNMWQATKSGLMVSLYGPSQLETKIEGKPISIEQVTDYPFIHRIKFIVEAPEKLDIELAFRIPEWADHAELEGSDWSVKGRYIVTKRDWKGSNELILTFDDKPRIREHHDMTSGIQHGPLLFALELKHKAKTGKTYSVPGFQDLFFEGMNEPAEQYQLSTKGQFTVTPPGGTPDWSNAPTLQGEMYDPVGKRMVEVEMLPMGNTVLRKVSFEIKSQQGATQ